MEAPAAADALDADASMWAVILAGGIGSRFWPLSGPKRPKPLLCLLSDYPLIHECVERLRPLVPPERILVVTSQDIAEGIAQALPQVPEWNVLVEPRPLGTAAAVALAMNEVERRAGADTVLVTQHADIAVGFPELFLNSLRQAGRAAAREDRVVVLGTAATRPDPQFGYITAPAGTAGDVQRVERYVEKPSVSDAEALVQAGALWHTGVGVARATVMRRALEQWVPEVAAALPHLEDGQRDKWFAAVRPVGIERGLYERCDALHVLRAEFGFDDVGTWASLRRARELDDAGNGGIGRAHFVDASGNIVHAEGSEVVLFGVDQLLVVSVNGMTLVTTLDRAADLRPVLERYRRSEG